MSVEAAIAMNRFGLGARAGQNVPAKPQSWLLDQIQNYQANPQIIASQPSRTSLVKGFGKYRISRRAGRKDREKRANDTNDIADVNATEMRRKDMRKTLRGNYANAVHARFQTAINSNTDFPERLTHFWSNHFAISANSLPTAMLAGNYEFQAIRPHIMDNFSDLLSAAVHHPAMLLFLDQSQSIGPGSQIAQGFAKRRRRKLGLNENLAREILELHTLGVRSGYRQNDVTELARAMTGRTVAGMGRDRIIKRFANIDSQPGDTIFVDAMHEPGKRTVLGKVYDGPGPAQAQAILNDLAIHPATAKHIATKLARHFTADTPPEKLVARLEQNFLSTAGDLPALYRTLVESPEVWSTDDKTPAKFKSPWEWAVSAARALKLDSLGNNGREARIFDQLGQPVWKPGSPAGYADTADTWAGGAALMRRVEIATRLGQRADNRIDPRNLAQQILPYLPDGLTREGIARAESPAQGLSLLLVSPEFLRR